MQEIANQPQLSVRRNQNPFPVLIFAKVVDDFPLAGQESENNLLYKQTANCFLVGRFTLKSKMFFYRLHIQRSESGTISFGIDEYMNEIPLIWMHRERKKCPSSSCTKHEIKKLQKLTGSLIFLEHGSLPQTSFAESTFQQRAGKLKT